MNSQKRLTGLIRRAKWRLSLVYTVTFENFHVNVLYCLVKSLVFAQCSTCSRIYDGGGNANLAACTGKGIKQWLVIIEASIVEVLDVNSCPVAGSRVL